MKENFINFLKEYEVFYRFESYVFHRKHKTIEEFLNRAPEHYISDAFLWKDTDEGRTFWEKLNNKWLDYISEKEITIKITKCDKANTAISLDVITALERMGYVVSLVEVE